MLTPLLYALWVVLPPLQSAIGYRMWARRLYREYPLFFAYTISQIGRFIVLFWSYHTGIRDVYRQAYLTAEAVDLVIKFGVICELFSHIFRPYDGIRQLGSTLLRWASVILLLIAVGVAAFSSGPDADRFLAGFFAMERSVAIVQVGTTNTGHRVGFCRPDQRQPGNVHVACGNGDLQPRRAFPDFECWLRLCGSDMARCNVRSQACLPVRSSDSSMGCQFLEPRTS